MTRVPPGMEQLKRLRYFQCKKFRPICQVVPDYAAARPRNLFSSQANCMSFAAKIDMKSHRTPMFRQVGLHDKAAVFEPQPCETKDRRLPQPARCCAVNAISDVAFGIFQVDAGRKREQVVCLADEAQSRRNPGVHRRAE